MANSENDPAGGAAPAGADAGAPETSKTAETAETPKPLSKVPRVSPPTVAQRREESAARGGAKVNLEDLITWLREGGPGGAKPEGADSSQSRLSKDQRKFRRYDPPLPRAAETGEGGAAELSAAAPVRENAAVPAVEAARLLGDARPEETAFRAEFVPRGRRREPAGPRGPWSSLGLQVGVVILMAAFFFLGRATVPVTSPAPDKRPATATSAPTGGVGAISLSDATLNVVDQAIAAENAGDMKKAAALYDQLKHGQEHVNGLDYYIGWLDYRTGKPAAAALAINASIAEGEYVGDCYGLRGLMLSRVGPGKSVHEFETAARASPFDAANFYYWGEALRRNGKLLAALSHLRQAVERASSPDEKAAYQLKVRLTQIELGQEKEFADQLATELALPRPKMEWLLTAAAEDMHNGNDAATVADLDRARQLADPARLASALNDLFFMGYAEKDSLRKIYAELCPPLSATAPHPGTPATSAAAPAVDSPVATTPLAAPDVASPLPAATP